MSVEHGGHGSGSADGGLGALKHVEGTAEVFSYILVNTVCFLGIIDAILGT